MNKVAIYIRVSTAKQDQDGYSIPLQKERLIAYCKAKGWVVAGIFIDPGHSGASLDRPGMVQLIEGVKSGKYNAVLVYKLDRLSRSQKDTLYLIEDVFMANNTDFVSLQESFDTSSIYGRAMIGVLSVFAQMERETIAERTLMGRAGRAEEGLWHGGGTAPIGYEYVSGELVINEEEAHQVRMVYELFVSGCTVTEITRRMEGFSTKHGDWSHTSTVGNVLDNPLYAGYVRFDGVRAKGLHCAIIDKSLNDKVKAMRTRQRRIEGLRDSAHLLTGFIFCASCGARYFPNKRPNGTVVYSCHSRAKRNRQMVKNPACKAPHFSVEELDAMVERELLELAENPERISEIKKIASEKGGSDVTAASEDVRRLDGEIARLMDLLQHNSMVQVGEIAARIEQIHAERTLLLSSSQETRDSMTYYDVLYVKNALKSVKTDWLRLDNRGKRAFLSELVDSVRIDFNEVHITWSFSR